MDRHVLAALLLAASCSAATPTPQRQIPERADPQPTEPEPAALSETQSEEPAISEDEIASVDLGTGWITFGVDEEKGSITSVWVPNEGDAQRQREFDLGAMSCDQGIEASAELLGDYVVVSVECHAGKDVLSVDTTSFVFTDYEDLRNMRVIWRGKTAFYKHHKTSGCLQSDGGWIELRGDQLWLVTEPYSEFDSVDLPADQNTCDTPPERAPKKLL